jgi:galactokinase
MNAQQTVTMIQAPDIAAETERTRALFVEQYGSAPEVIYACPGRLNLLGEHVDYSGGTCLPMALPQVTFVAAARTAPAEGASGVLRAATVGDTSAKGFRLKAPVSTASIPVDEIEPGHESLSGDNSWFAYVAGVWTGLATVGDDRLALPSGIGADLLITSTVPSGSGLSSSAALEGGVGLALLSVVQGITDPDDETRRLLAQACMFAENSVVGAKTGGLDQTAALRCEAGSMIVLDCRDFSVEQRPFDVASAGLEILVIDTKAPHQLADGQYAARRSATETAARLLGADLLRDLLGDRPTAEDADAALSRWDALGDAAVAEAAAAEGAIETSPVIIRRRLRHSLTEMVRVQQMQDLMTAESVDWSRAGELISATHASLRDDFEVTVPELDVAAETAESAGALGARMVGGGFGGSVMALVRSEDVDRTARAVADAFSERGFSAPEFLLAVPSEKGRRVA